MTQARQKPWIAICSAVTMMGIVGCGGSNEATVAGVVTLDGNAVPKGMISFIPSTGGTQAYAMTDEAGNYEVYTGREPGLKTGEYKVTIVARKKSAERQTADGGPAPPGEALTPRWYASPSSSGLAVKVDSGSNDINLELTSTPPAGWQDPAQRRR